MYETFCKIRRMAYLCEYEKVDSPRGRPLRRHLRPGAVQPVLCRRKHLVRRQQLRHQHRRVPGSVRGYLPVYGRFGLTGDTYFAARWTRRRGYEPLINSQTLGFRPGIYFPIGNVTLSTQIGFFGWTRTDYGNGNASSRWQARLEARDILIGVLFNL